MAKAYTNKRSKDFAGEIRLIDGEKTLVFLSDRWAKHQISQFNIGDRVSIYITTQIPNRSQQQNRFYWAYLSIISGETGHSPEELHEYFKGKYLTKEIKVILGSKVRIKGSTTELTKADFSDYMDKISAETNVPIPDTKGYFFNE